MLGYNLFLLCQCPSVCDILILGRTLICGVFTLETLQKKKKVPCGVVLLLAVSFSLHEDVGDTVHMPTVSCYSTNLQVVESSNGHYISGEPSGPSRTSHCA